MDTERLDVLIKLLEQTISAIPAPESLCGSPVLQYRIQLLCLRLNALRQMRGAS